MRLLFSKLIVFLFIILMSVSATAGSITGTATYVGEKPKLREIKMDADPICLTQHKEAVYPQTIQLGPNNELANVFLHVVQGLPKKDYPAPTEPAILNQKGCMYDPPVLGVMKGQPVKILNPDGTLHNVHALSKKNPEFNLAMPKFRTEVTKVFDQVEFMFEIKCDVHPWMVTHISVMDHPYFTTTGEDGKYTIGDLPPGEYVIEAWQQRLAPQRQTVTITSADDSVEINFEFSRPDGK